MFCPHQHAALRVMISGEVSKHCRPSCATGARHLVADQRLPDDEGSVTFRAGPQAPVDIVMAEHETLVGEADVLEGFPAQKDGAGRCVIGLVHSPQDGAQSLERAIQSRMPCYAQEGVIRAPSEPDPVREVVERHDRRHEAHAAGPAERLNQALE